MPDSLTTTEPETVRRARPWRLQLRAWGPAFLWAGFVFVMSSLPGATLPPLSVPNLDKVVHAAVYGILGMLCWRGVRLTQGLDPVRTVIMATAIATLYGITDEFHQMFTPNRMPDWRDAVADGGGSFLGALACAIVARGRTATKRQATKPERESEPEKEGTQLRSENRRAPL